ncbi:unnamed protein product [marine sediment metagenome]|uniref:Uncharacterized protein n=1 Tax=marine sediment metagenome TaxID=412755 RepID=X1SG61_9ZZZZ
MRKGSLSLSINAIVVLILAIVIMAFALPFIQKMFKSTTAEFETFARQEQPAPQANVGNPVTLSRNNLVMVLGDKRALRASVLNNKADMSSAKDILSQDCTIIGITDQSEQDIDKDKVKEVIMIISAETVGTKICTFTAITGVGGHTISIPVTVR